MKTAAVFLIKAYQVFISPLAILIPGGGCRFYPSCSEYTIQTIKNRGLIRGVGFGLKRIIKCNPWN